MMSRRELEAEFAELFKSHFGTDLPEMVIEQLETPELLADMEKLLEMQ